MTNDKLNQIIETSLGKIRSVADSNTVIGEPIQLNDNVVVLPFSKVSIGFAAGGSDYFGKKPETADKPQFAGGNGAGVSVTPLGFIIVNGNDVQVVDLKAPVAAAQQAGDNPVSKALEGINALIDKVPELWAKIKDKKQGKKEEATAEAEEKAE
ncbi:MAG: sporulation protein YtfJ [Ruminococcaceae bacterium]|nr:sporulation protein YtfJ [Oscillospiraceae bacterium]